MVLAKHIHHVHKPYHAHHPNQMHVHVIMHDLSHLPYSITAPMASMHEHVNACSCHLKQINKR